MITEKTTMQNLNDDEKTIPYGINVTYDGKKNVFLTGGIVKEYPIGGMICEYARLHPVDIKPVIMDCPMFHQKFNKGESMDTIEWLINALLERFDPVSAMIVATEIMDNYIDLVQVDEEKRKRALETDENEVIRKFILEDTGYDSFGMESMGQVLLSAYFLYSTSYCIFKYSFDLLMKSTSGEELSEEQEKKLDFFGSLYSENTSFQHIDFKIIAMEGKLQSLYQIKNGLSLLLFEVAHAIETESPIVRCEHCKQYFVPDGRSDMKYCPYPSPENSEKSCREVGAQAKRVQKEKNDVATKAYRKVYMRYTVHLSRHPDDAEKKALFDQMTSEVREWRNKMAHGLATEEEFFDWLNCF